MGGFYATPQDFLAQDESRRGIMYAEKHKSLKDSFHVAVSASLDVELPTLSPLLKAIAQAPGRCFKLYASERTLCTFFKNDRERHTASSEEGFRSRHAGRAS